MMVVDTSALIALYTREEVWVAVASCLAAHQAAYLPVPAYVEFTLISKLGAAARIWLDDFLDRGTLTLAPLETPHAAFAANAARIYGKGSGHPAQLNFGDCLTYAVAKHRDLPLLFVGDHFSQTDITPALRSG